MAIKASQVKELRELTGAGMMDCKKALTETDGDMDKAVEWLRENGMAKAQKKAGRIAAEGIVMFKSTDDGKKAAVVEVNSETDFASKNETFREYVGQVADQALTTSAKDIDAFLAEPWKFDTTKTVKEALDAEIAVISENMHIRRFAHADGKIGVLVDVETDVVNDAVKEMAKNVAMQIAAMRPQYTDNSEVPADYIEKETEILRAAIMNDPKESQKPEKVIEGMLKGRVNKELFVRFETGEGLEKKNEDFAAEVAAQAAGK